MGFFFLRTVIAADASICSTFVVWHVLFWDEETCVGAFYVAYALKESAEFVGKAVLPHRSVFVIFMRSQYSRRSPVSSSTIALMKWRVL